MTDDLTDTSPGPGRWLREHRRVIAIGTAVTALLVATGVYAATRDDSGNASGGTSAEGTAATEAAFEFAECVREQGIDNYPDPTIEGDGGIMFEGLSSLGVSDEDLKAATDACDQILDEAVSGPGASDEGDRHSTGMSGDELAAEGWDEITPDGDCECADGSDYSFRVREAHPEKVVLFLDGGGACWSAETCAPGGTNEYQTTTAVPSGEGVFDVDDERNPFADYSFVFVPYCTGDLHLGNATTEYTSDLTVAHRGYANGTAALDHLAETFPDATEVVVIGASAGSISAPLYAGLVADRLPDAEITSISDSSGGYPDEPEFNDILTGSAWDTTDAMSVVSTDLRSAPGLLISAAQRHPDIRFARYDHAYDENQASKVALAGGAGADLLTLIDTTRTQIENAGVDLHSYTAPGDQHVILGDDAFYDESVGGVDLVEWVAAVINNEPVDDVRCTECAMRTESPD